MSQDGGSGTMPSGQGFSVEEVKAMAAKEMATLRRGRQQTIDELPQIVLLWLALVPAWTEELLAQVARRQRRSSSEVRRVIATLEAQGWLRRQSTPPLPSQAPLPDILTLSHEVAERQLAPRLEGGGSRRLWTEIVTLGKIIVEVATQEKISQAAVPAVTLRWATLASTAGVREENLLQRSLGNRPQVESWQPVADLLDQRVEGLPAGEALRWIEAAQPLASVLRRSLDTQLDLAIRRAALRLELRDRRRYDLAHLKSFLERQDQIGALQRLLGRGEARDSKAAADADAEPWALHLLGSGGVGKTMLVRHLTAQLAADDAWDLTVARVDFDFLNPDYPRLAPGLLLWAFAQELRAFDRTGSAGLAFDDSERLLQQLHDLLKAGEVAGQRTTEHTLFVEGIEIYAQALELLPEPVVLVVDTCEELTKPRAGADSRFNVDATFHILEILHHRLPSLRVVFAGRRPLATAGAGWRCDDCQLLARPYLALFAMRGFSHDEARTYLRRQEVPDALVEPVVRRSSPDAGSAASIAWLEGEGPADIERCNPYELHFFSQWALDDPPPCPEDIEQAGGERYVELRILRRLQNPQVASLLPLLGLARHVDDELLQAVSGLGDDEFKKLMDDLLQQEWVERQPITSGQTPRRMLSIEEGLRLRLVSYAANHPGQLDAHRRITADLLRRRTLEGDPAELDVRDLDAALRVMGSLPEADLWWRQVEEHLLAERDAAWVAQQMSYLVGPEGAAAKPDEASWPELRTVHPLRPAVLATFALAESRQPGGGLTPWMEVAETAATLPNIGADLELRARASALAVGRRVGQEIVPGDAWDVWRRSDTLPEAPSAETAAALVAAVEALVEQADALEHIPWSERAPLLRTAEDGAGGVWAPRGLLRRFDAWETSGAQWLASEVSRRLRAMLLCLDGRVTARLGEHPEEAVKLFERAISLAETSPSSRLLAWREPEHLPTRIQLEALRALYPAVLEPKACFGKFGALDGRSPDGIERDRFLAMIVELVLAEGRGANAFPIVRQAEVDDPVMEPNCRAHFEVPPLKVQMARLATLEGDIDAALSSLGEIARRASRYPTSVVRHAARAEIELAIRLRMLQGLPGAALGMSKQEDDHDLIELFEALGGEPRTKVILHVVDSRRAVHASWRLRTSLSHEQKKEAFEVASHRIQQIEDAGADEAPEAIDLHLMLDAWEGVWLYPYARGIDTGRIFTGDLLRFIQWAAARLPGVAERQSVEAWEIRLRLLAADRWHRDEPQDPHLPEFDELARSLIRRLGPRRAGLLAWRQGDYLALRSPSAAVLLFTIARHLFAEAGDALGEAICCTAQGCCLASDPAIRLSPKWLGDLRDCWQRAGLEASKLETDDDLKRAMKVASRPLRPWWARALLLGVSSSPLASLRQDLPHLLRRHLGERREPMLAWVDRQPSLTRGGDGGFSIPGALGADDIGPDDTGPDDTGPDDTGPDDTGPDDTGPNDFGPEDERDLTDDGVDGVDSGQEGAKSGTGTLQTGWPDDSEHPLDKRMPPSPSMPPSPPLPVPPSPPVQPSAPVLKKKEAESPSNWEAFFLVVLVPLGILGAMAAAYFYGVRWTGSRLGVELPAYGWISVCLFLFCSAIYAVQGFREARGLWRGRRWLKVTVDRATEDVKSQDFISGLELTAQRVITKLRLGVWPFGKRVALPSEAHRLDLEAQPHRRPYSHYLADDGALFAQPFFSRNFAKRAHQLVVLDLQHRPEVAWEGALHGGSTRDALRFRRQVTLPRSRDEAWGPNDGPTLLAGWPKLPQAAGENCAVVVASRSEQGAGMAKKIWSALGSSGIEAQVLEEPQLTSLVPTVRGQGERPERIVHLIGAVIETSAGRRFRLGRMGQGTQPMSQSSSVAGDAEVIDLRPTDLARAFPDLCLVVLQEEPVVAMNRRSAADRRQADWLRAFAHDVHGAASPAVLTVPHLLPITAADCLRPLAELLKQRRRWIDRLFGDRIIDFDTSLLDVVDAMRQVIIDDPKVDHEAAWDIVLYSPAGWRNPYCRERKG